MKKHSLLTPVAMAALFSALTIGRFEMTLANWSDRAGAISSACQLGAILTAATLFCAAFNRDSFTNLMALTASVIAWSVTLYYSFIITASVWHFAGMFLVPLAGYLFVSWRLGRLRVTVDQYGPPEEPLNEETSAHRGRLQAVIIVTVIAEVIGLSFYLYR